MVTLKHLYYGKASLQNLPNNRTLAKIRFQSFKNKFAKIPEIGDKLMNTLV